MSKNVSLLHYSLTASKVNRTYIVFFLDRLSSAPGAFKTYKINILTLKSYASGRGSHYSKNTSTRTSDTGKTTVRERNAINRNRQQRTFSRPSALIKYA